ncbi:putative NADPH-dependent 1-acyl dihydroxyacetone phosphate reductase [Aspergillus sclerotioniger CBS 115572]|uniref:Putative NADPH-dependent 1-acyl dihydroxyacetone phosphate reductase n=1 Tax=Aspergillus sclerotioniger CBS 115572 TaxID=1450535 RepID=A0A317VHP2_9EURO|nr:putative NADPH-dependent 1-acyl dihydroxyacetone phosphate reductase [Aspergillus sclerotioniger CBS 115572]PWY73894.1 putative NADPH-dependent 1-acyl dihydroxyacetone phosphate reductase [Aspergillus sclerotioniger CBS 115572]
MPPTIVFITGTNRGIGKGILELYLKKPNHTVIAANRDPNHPTSTALADLPKAEGTTLLIVKHEATSPTDSAAAVKELLAQGISHIDILIANAAIALCWPKVSEVKVEDIQKHVDVNVYGFIRLYQAFRPLLQEARDPKWVTIGSNAGNFGPFPNAAYAPSKVVQHWYTRSISAEDPWLTAFPIDPGWVQTDLGQRGADWFGVDRTAAITVEESVTGVVKVIDASTRETHSGKLTRYNGKEEPW